MLLALKPTLDCIIPLVFIPLSNAIMFIMPLSGSAPIKNLNLRCLSMSRAFSLVKSESSGCLMIACFEIVFFWRGSDLTGGTRGREGLPRAGIITF